MQFWNLNLLSGTLGIPSGGGGCATHKPPHQKARRKSASKRKRVVTASIKARGPRGPSQEGWHDKQAIANKPMGLKWGLLAPTPERGRICMPRKTIDKQTKKPISDKTIHRVFKTFCYDEQEGDCWQYRNAPQQDCFTERDYPARVNCPACPSQRDQGSCLEFHCPATTSDSSIERDMRGAEASMRKMPPGCAKTQRGRSPNLLK